jgi:hypothetical protein
MAHTDEIAHLSTCRLSGVDRKWSACGQTNATGPKPTALSLEHDSQLHPFPFSAGRRLRVPMSHVLDGRRPLVSSFFPNG